MINKIKDQETTDKIRGIRNGVLAVAGVAVFAVLVKMTVKNYSDAIAHDTAEYEASTMAALNAEKAIKQERCRQERCRQQSEFNHSPEEAIRQERCRQQSEFDHSPEEVCEMVDQMVTTLLKEEGYNVVDGNSFVDVDSSGRDIATCLYATRESSGTDRNS